MDPQQPSARSTAAEVTAVWYAGWTSVTLALVALIPSWPLRALTVALAAALAITLARHYLDIATAFTAALITVGSALFSIGTVIWLSGLPWRTGISWSQAGRIGRPTAWLFAAASLCLGVSVLAAGRLLVREGRRRGVLSERVWRRASILPVVSFAGFWVVAFTPVGLASVTDAAHNLASWAALGVFWFGMLATPWLGGVSRALRVYSGIASAVVFFTWLPNGLRFLRLYAERPIPMLVMELVVFPACAVWFCWLALEWSRPAEAEVSGSADPPCSPS